MKLIRKIALVRIQYREFQAALAAFRRLSDHELSKAGWVRGDIVRLAFEEAERVVSVKVVYEGRAIPG